VHVFMCATLLILIMLGVDIVTHDRFNKTCTIQLDGDDRINISRMKINLLTQEMKHTNSIFVTNN
jgi:hypothetical protein